MSRPFLFPTETIRTASHGGRTRSLSPCEQTFPPSPARAPLLSLFPLFREIRIALERLLLSRDDDRGWEWISTSFLLLGRIFGILLFAQWAKFETDRAEKRREKERGGDLGEIKIVEVR